MIIPKVQKKRFRVDMAPLIDVVFLLLIFFMLTFAIQGKGLELSQPQGGPAAGSMNRSPVIRIQNGDQIRLDNHPIALDALKEAIQLRMENVNPKLMVIEAEGKARYELFVQVMDISRQAGVKDFSIISEYYQ